MVYNALRFEQFRYYNNQIICLHYKNKIFMKTKKKQVYKIKAKAKKDLFIGIRKNIPAFKKNKIYNGKITTSGDIVLISDYTPAHNITGKWESFFDILN